MQNLLYLLIVITLLPSCNKGIDDPSKRNENWCWHVPKATGKGEWIKLGGNETFPDGLYTLFYPSGKNFEKGKTEDGTEIDTISSFDINGNISKYTYYLSDTSYEYYLNDGPFKAWDSKGNLTEEATVKNHKVYDQKWYGSFAHFVSVIDICLPSKNSFRAVSKKLKETITTATETKANTIPEEDFKQMDSLLAIALIKNQQSIDALTKLEEFSEMPKYKQDALLLMQAQKTFLSQHVAKTVAIFKTGFNDANIEKSHIILLEFADKDQTEKNFSDAATLFQEKFMLDLGQAEYLNERFPDHIVH